MFFQFDTSLPHIYDTICHARSGHVDAHLLLSPQRQPRSTAPSDYQVPPPPRPVVPPGSRPSAATYLNVPHAAAASSPSPKAGASKPKRRRQKSDKSDPYGTLRASPGANDDSDDVFLPSKDPFGTLRANAAVAKDYRSSGDKKESLDRELAVTNELLQLLEDFKSKSYSVKEMEAMFDHWRRKAALTDDCLPSKAKVSASLDNIIFERDHTRFVCLVAGLRLR